MLHYIISFSLYTLAMAGIFFIAFIVYRKSTDFKNPKFNNGIKIEDMLRISQRKTLYIINVEGNRFLIASDFENTTLLANLPAKNEGIKNDSKRNLLKEKFDIKNLTSLYSPNDIRQDIKNVPDENYREIYKSEVKDETAKNVEKYIKELQALDTAMGAVEEHPKTEDDYSNAVDLKSKKTIMKNILRELENNSKRTNY